MSDEEKVWIANVRVNERLACEQYQKVRMLKGLERKCGLSKVERQQRRRPTQEKEGTGITISALMMDCNGDKAYG